MIHINQETIMGTLCMVMLVVGFALGIFAGEVIDRVNGKVRRGRHGR